MKYSRKELKKVMKNMATTGKISRYMDFDFKQFVRHVYLAYQWVKHQDLTKAENPKYTRHPIQIELFLLILKEWEYDLTLNISQLKHLFESQGFKTQKSYISSYAHTSTITNKSFMKAYYALKINPIISEDDLHPSYFQYFLKILYSANFPAKIYFYSEGKKIEFENGKGSKLSIFIGNDFISNSSIQYTFLIAKKKESSGIIKIDGSLSAPANETIISMIDEIALDSINSTKENK